MYATSESDKGDTDVENLKTPGASVSFSYQCFFRQSSPPTVAQ